MNVSSQDERQEGVGAGARPEDTTTSGTTATVSAEKGATGEPSPPDAAPPEPRGPEPSPDAKSAPRPTFTPAQRLLVLDTWQRSGLPASTFATICGVSAHTLYEWNKRFKQQGPAGLEDGPRGGPKGSRMSEVTRRAVLLLKRTHPEWGLERIRDVLARGEGYGASPGAIRKVLLEEGYEPEEVPSSRHPDRVREFERARPNQLWQSDLFTFLLKREGRRLHLVVFLDDHSRYVVSFGLAASATNALVREALETGIANYGAPEEVLTDRGPQYHSWRGKSAFTKLLERRGIHHILARPRHPQTVGKTERFWGTLWRELLQEASLSSVEEARTRIGHFVDHYNFQRPHQGIEGLVPADRYFQAAPEVRQTLEARIAANARELAQHGTPRKSLYLTGRIGDRSIALHGEGGKVVLTDAEGRREEVDLEATGRRQAPVEEVEP